jgi:hypothetical protein
MLQNKNEMADGSITVLKHEGPETIHHLWSTPVVIAKPFDDTFMTQLKKDVEQVLPRAQKNSVDVWALPDLPETMLMVRDKELEIANRVFKADAEMPLPDLKISKGYFRHIHPNVPYRITPHHHGSTLGAGVFYIKLNNDNPGNMIFMDPRGGVNYNNQFSPFKRVRLEEGMMLITPGYLVHFVEPTDYNKPVYQERLLLVSNIHRMYEDWIKKLDENENEIKSMGSFEL